MRKPSNQTTSTKQSEEQFSTDLGEFFGSIPGMRDIFNKGPLNQSQKQATAPDHCAECEADTAYSLNKCRSAGFRVEVLAVLAGDLINRDADVDRITAILYEIENQARDIQAIAGPAM